MRKAIPSGSTEVHQVTGEITLERITVYNLPVPPTTTFFLNESKPRLTRVPEPSDKYFLCDG